MAPDENVRIFDTTLRDGEQSPGISLNLKEKVEIAEQLARLGVDIIEAGFPIASAGETEAVQAIARTVRGPVIAGLARVEPGDIDRAAEAVGSAERARIHTFIATSEVHMRAKLRMTPDEVLQASRAGVERARGHVADVEFSCEDATRSDPEFVAQVFRAAVEAGATTLNVPDTVGYCMPQEYANLLTFLIREVDADVVWSVHTHDDLGLAVANALAGVEAGARQIEVAVNGIGERAGNCSLEEVVMAIRTREVGSRQAVATGVNTTEIARTSRLVSMLTGYAVPPNKAIVGANAFAHEAGIHQHGVMAERTTYEIMDPVDVGLDGSRIVLGKHSGRHAFANALVELGFTLSPGDIQKAFDRFKELADRKIRITDVDLEAIVVEEIGSEADQYELVSIQVAGGTHLSPTATVRLRRDGEVIDESAIGDGMIDAACGAVQRATGIEARLESFNVSSVTGGIDALGDVTIVLAVGDGSPESPVRRATGRGVSTDVVEASARAYLSAVNRLFSLAARGGLGWTAEQETNGQRSETVVEAAG
ncbi:MAG: 2-isopropylmalate synthase [Actinobacteria bacterium]|nr:2-isopropylmalate synthase [Actinomycetota bacterium]